MTLVGVFLAVWIAVMLVGGESGVLAQFRVRDKRVEMEARVKALEEENRALRQEVERLLSDPAEIERIAREELMMARPGEEVILFPSVAPIASPAP